MTNGFKLFIALAAAALLFGCESSKSSDSGNGVGSAAPEASDSGDDEMDFSSLNFAFGGVDGSGAESSGVKIANLRTTGSPPDGYLSFDYVSNLRAWGYTDNSDAPALACFFVKRSDGTWVGGKMDWIGTSRTSRDFHNLYPGRDGKGYGGWTLSGVPNPCECAFLILTADGKRRSNVIATTWTR